MEYRKEIDGLRALAVTAVVLYHFGFISLQGGFYGVDVFFVISGYLISSLLFSEIAQTGTLSFSGFYLRRTRRILPALLVCCVGTYCLFAVFLQQVDVAFPRFGEAILAAIFSVSNIFYWLHAGYFAPEANVQPLLHTWSLGVEEQFYIVIPFLLFFLSQRKGRLEKHRALILGALAVVSFVLCRWGRHVGLNGDFIFYMLPTRMWELLVGVGVALLLRRFDLLNTRWLNVKNLLAVVSLGVMIFGFFFYFQSKHIAEKGLVITLMSAIFLLFANKHTYVGQIFSMRGIRFIGKISYSWYLWHWPFFVLSHLLALKYVVEDDLVLRLTMCSISIVAAYLSWKYVEQPFRTKRTWKECVKPLAPAFTLLILLGGALALGALSPADGIALNRPDFERIVRHDIHDIQQRGLTHLGQADKKPTYILIGDSHLSAVHAEIEAAAAEYGLAGVGLSTHNLRPLFYLPSESPHSEAEREVADFFWDYIKKNDIKSVILCFRFDSYLNRIRKFSGAHPTNSGNGEIFRQELLGLIDKLVSRGCDVWFVEQVPLAEFNPVLRARLLGGYTEALGPELHNQIIRQAVNEYSSPKVHSISSVKLLAPEGRIRFVADNKFLYLDADHLSYDGAEYIKEIFPSMFFSVANDKVLGLLP